jgi:hypothetical protein
MHFRLPAIGEKYSPHTMAIAMTFLLSNPTIQYILTKKYRSGQLQSNKDLDCISC